MVFGLSQQSIIGQLIWLVMFFVLIGLYPKYLMHRMLSEMEAVVETLQSYTKKSVETVKKVAAEKGGTKKDPTLQVERMLEFFVIPPVNLDPYGILSKLEYVLDRAEDRFEKVSKEISPKADRIWMANVNSLLKGALGMNMLTKILRHYIEFAKKTGNIQITMLIHMQLPLIKKVAKAQMEGIETISKGKPIGDGIGPLVAAGFVTGKVEEIGKDVAYSRADVKGRAVHVIKAFGPGANLGKIGDAVKSVGLKEKVEKIITVDAALKLEGEESGSVSEGIGAAIGDPGPEKSKIEEAAIELGIPLEAIVVKMSVEEAISPLTKNIASAVKKVNAHIIESVQTVAPGAGVLLVGVGNTCGVGNTKKEIKGMRFPSPKEEEEKVSFTDRIIKKIATPPKQPEKKDYEKKRTGL